MTRSSTRASWVLPLLLAALLSACGGSDSTAGEPAIDSARSGTTHLTEAEMVRAVEVRPDDLPGKYGSTNRFGEAGDGVDGYVTLDMCGAAFASEDLRTARHQVAYSAPDGDSISTETVAYESRGAQQAMAELRDAIANCPKGFVRSNVAGQPIHKLAIKALPEEADWQEDTLAMRVTVTPENEPGMSGVLIFQRRGDLMTAVYVWAGPRTSPELAADVASLLSERLEAAAPVAGTAS
jgi:hypothetical protein